ncbi:MAG: MarC family protein [Ignavibacteriaceae bacterium]|nr:MarC family protein [Ignavibacteriaceae bacterium]
MGDLLNSMLILIPLGYMAMFHVINPLGTGLLFLNQTAGLDSKTRRIYSQKIAVYCLILLLGGLLTGAFILNFFGISIPVVQICGGLLIATMGYKSISVRDSQTQATESNQGNVDIAKQYKEQLFYPLTFPMTVGPGSLAVVITLSAEALSVKSDMIFTYYLSYIIAIVLNGITIYFCFGYSDFIINKLPLHVRTMVMKFFSFILFCIGGQIMVSGLIGLLKILK